MVNLEKYRLSESDQARTADLLRVLPTGRYTVLDIGARDGHFSRLLTDYFASVTAMDLERPPFAYPRVTTVAGDATGMKFPDNAFDCIFCTEVLEHIPNLTTACREIIRVARYEIVIGVPFEQDIRIGRMTCQACGSINPPWGHVNSFTEQRLLNLFPGFRVLSKSFVGISHQATNPVSVALMDLAGNPWGTYDGELTCSRCHTVLAPPTHRPLGSKICSALAHRINRLQTAMSSTQSNWIHMVFQKTA